MKKIKTQYIINYDRYSVIDGKEGYILFQGKTCDNIKDLQNYIKEHVKEKDRNINIIRREIYKYNLKEFMNIQEQE